MTDPPGAGSEVEMNRVYALLGDPVEHSLSPVIQNAAFLELDIDATYVTLRVAADEVRRTMRAVARRSGGRGGGNVTLPHKEAAARELDDGTVAVEVTGACNCFWGAASGELAGDNTDVEGFELAVGELPEVALEGSRTLLLGAGGAARAVLYALLRSGAARVEVLNRTADRARAVARRITEAFDGRDVPPRVEVIETREGLEGPYDLVVNATSLGLDPSDPLPLELEDVEVGAAFDLVYGPDGTPWTRRARELGIPVADGTGMLVHQAGLSLRRWTDREPPLAVMREAARGALAARGGDGGRF